MKRIKFTERINWLKGTMELVRSDRIYPVVIRNKPITMNTTVKKPTNTITTHNNSNKKKYKLRILTKNKKI